MKLARVAMVSIGLLGGFVLMGTMAGPYQVQAAQQLSDAELQQKLQSQGYSDIRDIRHNGNRVRLTALQNGQRVQLTVDARTGQPVGEGTDDDDDDD
jgi:hypothetical protein